MTNIYHSHHGEEGGQGGLTVLPPKSGETSNCSTVQHSMVAAHRNLYHLSIDKCSIFVSWHLPQHSYTRMTADLPIYNRVNRKTTKRAYVRYSYCSRIEIPCILASLKAVLNLINREGFSLEDSTRFRRIR